MSKSKLDDHEDFIIEALADGSSQREVVRALRDRGESVARSTLQHWLDQRGIDGLATPAEEELIPVIFRDYSDLEKLHVYPLGDVHVGAPSFQEEKWERWLDYLFHHKQTSLLNTGDNINAAIIGSKSDVYTETMTADDAIAKVREDLRPLAEAGRIDAIGEGNHEARIYRATSISPMKDVARELRVPYWKTAAVVVYQVGDVEYEIFVRHGSGGGATAGAKANKLQKQRNTLPTADVFVSGHTHSQLVFPEDILLRRGRRLERRKQLFVSSGSFLGLEDYAVVNGMSPQHIGAPRIRLDGRRRDPHVSV